jgi:hypothetical protein
MRLVARIGASLFVRVVGVLAIDVTELKVLVLTPGGTLPVVALVVLVTTIVAKFVLLASAMMMATMMAVIVLSIQPVAPALVGDMAYLTCILFFQLVA